MEKEIGRQFFPKMPIVVKFYERFRLSGQYDAGKLMDIYGESIRLELQEASPVEYNLFKRADIAFDGSKMQLTLEDTVPGREKAAELTRILEKIYNERCGIPVQIDISYKERKTGKYREEDEHRLAMQVAEISARAGYAVATKAKALWEEENPEKSVEPGSKPVEKQKKPVDFAVAAEQPKRRSGDRERGEQRRPLKRSDNPDVIYGRDFDDEAMPIEDIIGEMGEVVIRGKVIRKDSREIKNERMILIYDITDYTDTMTVKFFVHKEQVNEITSVMKEGAFVKLKGMTMMDKFDHELTIGSLAGIKKIPDFTNFTRETEASESA